MEISGVIVFFLITAVCCFLFWRWATHKQRRAKWVARQKFPEHWQALLNTYVEFYQKLGQKNKKVFEQRIAIFLDSAKITAVQTELDDLTQVLTAASAVIPTWGYKDWQYPDLGEIYITNGAVDVQNLDGNQSFTLGQIRPQGNQHMVVLSKQALVQGFKNSEDGKNVGIHEFTHLLDEEDGEVDGIPLQYLPPELVPAWERLVEIKMREIKEGKSKINTYGATSRTEYFAVITEYFFERPRKLLKKQPGLYRIMTKIFRQNPARLFSRASVGSNSTTGTEIGRNDSCPCGSGQKYKKCCLPKLEASLAK